MHNSNHGPLQPRSNSPPSVWIENTTSKGDHGGAGWEFGTCVWCPAKDRRGSEGKYKIIREVKAGDLVINCYDGVIRGTSRAKNACYTTNNRPTNPGDWGYATAYCRFDLENFHELPSRVPVRKLIERFKDELSREIETAHPPYYLFSWWPRSQWYPEGRVVISQGRFLARATPMLCRLIDSLAGLDEATFRSILTS